MGCLRSHRGTSARIDGVHAWMEQCGAPESDACTAAAHAEHLETTCVSHLLAAQDSTAHYPCEHAIWGV